MSCLLLDPVQKSQPVPDLQLHVKITSSLYEDFDLRTGESWLHFSEDFPHASIRSKYIFRNIFPDILFEWMLQSFHKLNSSCQHEY